jgi:hypothetical protein
MLAKVALHFSEFHFCFTETEEKKTKKKKKGKPAFQGLGRHLLVCSTQASGAVICYKKLI